MNHLLRASLVFLVGAALAVNTIAQNQALSCSTALGTGSGYIEIPSSPTLTPAAFTFEAWFTYIDTGLPAGWVYPTLGRKNFTQGIAEWFLRVDAGNAQTRNLRLWINGTSGVTGITYPFVAGAFLSWTHVAATYDGTTARLYLNGSQVAQATGTGPLVGLGAPARIGAGDTAVGSANERWNGLIDDVRIWAVARTQPEIAANMYAHLQTVPNLNASYLLDGTGLDSSGNSNHGAGVASPSFVVVPSPTPLYETNSSGSSLDFNGVIGTPLVKATTTVCSSALVTVHSDGTALLPWEAAFNGATTVPATSPGAFTTGGGQIVNLDLANGLFFLFGGVAPSLAPYAGAFTATFGAPPPGTTTSFQQLNIDPLNPEGFSLSQAAELTSTALTIPPTPFAGPTGDDSQVQVNVGCVVFHGRSFTTMFIQSNGRLTFGAGNTTFNPTAALFATHPPSFGCWTDFNPALGGSIAMNQPSAGVMNVAYNGINYFGTTIANNFQLEVDTNSGIVSIIGLTGLAVGTGNMLIGVSGGNIVGATIPAAVNFSPGSAGSTGATSNGTDMIYALGQRGLVTAGINRIDFIPNGFNNYDWLSQ